MDERAGEADVVDLRPMTAPSPELVIPPSDYDLWIDSRLEPLLGL